MGSGAVTDPKSVTSGVAETAETHGRRYGLTVVWDIVLLLGLCTLAILDGPNPLPLGIIWLFGCLVPGYLFVVTFGLADLIPVERWSFSPGAGIEGRL